jgi:hypothetical protein
MTTKPYTYIADLKHLPKALQKITALKRWVIWCWEPRINKKTGAKEWTKPPYQCAHPKVKAKSNDPSTWGTYEDAVGAVTAGKANGIGFMLKDSEVAAVDVDHVRDVQTGELVGWARPLCAEADQLKLYREVTVSGCGLRFIGLSQGDELHRKFTFNRKSGAGIELYRNMHATSRYPGCRKEYARIYRRSTPISTHYWRASISQRRLRIHLISIPLACRWTTIRRLSRTVHQMASAAKNSRK